MVWQTPGSKTVVKYCGYAFGLYCGSSYELFIVVIYVVWLNIVVIYWGYLLWLKVIRLIENLNEC